MILSPNPVIRGIRPISEIPLDNSLRGSNGNGFPLVLRDTTVSGLVQVNGREIDDPWFAYDYLVYVQGCDINPYQI